MGFYLGFDFINDNGETVVKFIYGMSLDKIRYKSKHSPNQHHNYFYTQCRMKMIDIYGDKFNNIRRYKINYIKYSEYIFANFKKNKIFYIPPLSDCEYYPNIIIGNTYIAGKEDTWESIARSVLGSKNNAEYLALYNNQTIESAIISGEVINIPNIALFKNTDDPSVVEESSISSTKIRSILYAMEDNLKDIIPRLSYGDIVLVGSNYSSIRKLCFYNGKELQRIVTEYDF